MKTIYIDPGHGGTDPGAVNGKRYESHDVLRLAQKVYAILAAQPGITPVLTRNSDKNVTLTQRISAANKAGGAAFVSLHRNAFTAATAKGFESYHQRTPTARDKALTKAVHDRIVQAGVSVDRGIKQADFRVCKEPNMPSCLIEYLFITNTDDNKMFDQKIDEYAKATALGILDYLGIKYIEPISPNPEQNILYRVRKTADDAAGQLGAYIDINNAKATADRRALDGYKVFDVEGAVVYDPTVDLDGAVNELTEQVKALQAELHEIKLAVQKSFDALYKYAL